MCGYTEVNDFNDEFLLFNMVHLVDEKIFGFNIAMHYLSLVAMSDCRQKLSHDICGFILAEGFLFKNGLKELPART